MGSHRRGITFIALTALLAAHPSFALGRRPLTYRNVLSADPLSALFAGVAYVSYERVLHSYVGLVVGPQIQFSHGLFDRDNGEDIFAAGVEAGARIYVSGEAPVGFFVTPQLEVAYASLRRGGAAASGVSYGGAAMIGYQRVISDRFVLSAGIGARYTRFTAVVNSSGVSYSTQGSGFSPAVHGAFGVTF